MHFHVCPSLSPLLSSWFPFDDGGDEICDVAAVAAAAAAAVSRSLAVNSLKGKQICGPKMCARAAAARASVSDRVRGGTVADPLLAWPALSQL